MCNFKLLLVEDNDQDMELCRVSVKEFQEEHSCEIDLIISKNLDEAFEKLDNSFDATIIDLKLGEQGTEGSQVVKRIEKSHFRIPVAILTGTPDAVDSDFDYVGVFKKGETGYADLLNIFWGIHNTGLTRIMGGRGLIEKTLSDVFHQNLLPQREKWVKYGKANSFRTEKALLRYALSHLLQLLDDDGDRCYPEEVYLTPPLTDKIRTGSVVKEKNRGHEFVVMNPACDLVIREEDKCKTDRILIVEIDSQTSLFPGCPATNLSENYKKKLERAYKNNKSAYYHWLPKTDFFSGGFMNFRKLLSLPREEFDNQFENPAIQISSPFVKDIQARFSAYYARQGQPDIDFDAFINPPEASQ